jgi:hypothetical protein
VDLDIIGSPLQAGKVQLTLVLNRTCLRRCSEVGADDPVAWFLPPFAASGLPDALFMFFLLRTDGMMSCVPDF